MDVHTYAERNDGAEQDPVALEVLAPPRPTRTS